MPRTRSDIALQAMADTDADHLIRALMREAIIANLSDAQRRAYLRKTLARMRRTLDENGLLLL